MKTVLVTGASRGIGFAIAEKFSDENYRVILNSSTDSVFESAKKIRNSVAFRADISDSQQVSRMVKEVGCIDVLVNNAGVSHVGLFQYMNNFDIDKLVNINIRGVLNCCRAVVPSMIQRHSGVIVNISSVWGNVGASCEVVYSMTKGAVNAFTRALGKELAPSNIRVNGVACGVTQTSMNNFLSQEEYAALKESIPLGRFANPEEIANVVFFLSTEQSSYITGQIITADGGFL
jgi:3-oxoacyl-[acyl-carrier protein] reductase